MAAGIAIALLPGDTPRNEPRSEVTGIRAEANGMEADPGALAPRGAAARLADPAPRRNAASPSAAETDKATPPAPPGQAEALPARPGAMAEPPQEGLSAGTEAEATFRHALDLAIDDSRAAVIAYARAAMLGHERAAYYLGQIYETGDGVPVDLAIARHWYEVSSAGNARARNRLAELPEPERSGDLAAPLPLLAEASGAGQADFVWTSGQGADPASYVVELGTDARDGAVAAYPVTGSAARLPLAAEAGYWRVVALDVSGSRRMASDWKELAPAAPDRAAAEPEPTGHL
jgi:hypothetical protein